jgi:hypothetical protein
MQPVSTLVCVARNWASNYPHSFSNNCHLPFMFVTGTVSFVDTTAALPNYGGRSPKLGDPDERFCGSYRMFRPDGNPLAHDQCPMADVLRTGASVREEEVHIERPNGTRGIALVNIEAIKDSGGIIIGAVNSSRM